MRAQVGQAGRQIQALAAHLVEVKGKAFRTRAFQAKEYFHAECSWYRFL